MNACTSAVYVDCMINIIDVFDLLDRLPFINNNRWFRVTVFFWKDVDPQLQFALKQQSMEIITFCADTASTCISFWYQLIKIVRLFLLILYSILFKRTKDI